ncbi:btk-binding protein-related [Anaeramoeba flamelloides]|uniref:Btk-binding protein-related n=1 Tax=Anaeramoeba flamelloides TaxID=1746091 RepID=A0AAV8AFL3_9EUKA|nr:btk-binding protein-related [Anaeramoeba flamelloides]
MEDNYYFSCDYNMPQLLGTYHTKSSWDFADRIQKIKMIRKVSFAKLDNSMLILFSDNKLSLFQAGNRISTNLKIENILIIDIKAGFDSYLILTNNGEVYSLAKYQTKEIEIWRNVSLPFENPGASSFRSLRKIVFFEQNNLFVIEIMMTSLTNYFLCNNNQLYACGFNKYGQLCNGSTKNEQTPILIKENVERIFSCTSSDHLFYLSNNKLFGCGRNTCGQLGISSNEKQIADPIQVETLIAKGQKYSLDCNQILDIKMTCNDSYLLTQEGKIFQCGKRYQYSQESSQYFTELNINTESKIIKLDCGFHHAVFLTEDDDLFGVGFTHKTQTFKHVLNQWAYPVKLKLPTDFRISNPNNSFKFFCGDTIVLILHSSYISSCLRVDFKKLYKSKSFYDSYLIDYTKKNKIFIHKKLLEIRIKKDFEQIQEILKKFGKEKINLFLKWVYYEKIHKEKVMYLEQIFNFLKLSFPPQNSLENDFENLYHDEQSKDFAILTRGDEEEEEEGKYEEIKVHKFILIARSKIFRDMFESLNEEEKNINKIKDYTGKSKESLEILIKYFYTDKITITKKQMENNYPDFELIIKELEDSVEYYQLDENSKLSYEINKLKSLYKKK